MANDTYALSILTAAAGQFAENVLHYTKATSATDSDPFTTANSLITQWVSHNEANFLACLPTDAAVSGFKCKRINNGGGPTAVVVQGDNGTGEAETSLTSAGACLIFPYSNGTRFFAGRMFMPFAWDGAYVQNEPDETYKTNVQTFLTGLATALVVTAVNYALTVWSKKHTTNYAIVGKDVSLKVGTQRRRLTPIM
jgi:hypothetical protein